MTTFVVIAMVFCHIFDDYKLQQGVLANMKQKNWWAKNASDEMYKHDYIVALCMHSLSWSFMIQLPIAFYFGFCVDAEFVITFVINAAVHAIVDDLKANQRRINLVIDQLIHMAQIALTALMLLR